MKVSTYIKENKTLLIIGIFIVVFPGCIIYLSEDIDFILSDGFYCIFVTAFLFLLFIICDYLKKKRKCRMLCDMIGSSDLDFTVSLPDADTYEQKLYTALMLQLKNNFEKEFSKVQDKKIEDIEFIETWVHEIKTPIAAIKLIVENAIDSPTEKTLYDISDQVLKIEDMVLKTICYSQLNDFSKDCRVSNVSVKKIINKCMKSEYANITNKHLNIKMHKLDFEVNSDEKWLSFIVKQILDNAVKYSKENGEIYIEGINEINNQKIIIKDFGIGICTEDLRRIFEKGYTGFNGRKRVISTGVGLYLSNKLAKKLGHTISINSTINEGTKVEIILQK